MIFLTVLGFCAILSSSRLMFIFFISNAFFSLRLGVAYHTRSSLQHEKVYHFIETACCFKYQCCILHTIRSVMGGDV